MPRSRRTALTEPDDLPLVFVGGDPALDLVNTIDWRSGGVANERLTSYARLTEWAEGAGVLSRREGQRLRKWAAEHPRDAAGALTKARSLRSLLVQLFHGIVTGSVPASVWSEFDQTVQQALTRLGIGAGPTDDDPEAAAHWYWRGGQNRLDALLWPVVRSAARLLTSDEARVLRVCEGPDCGWVFVDRSRNGLRRWCEMRTCGTSAKTRRRRLGAR